MSAGTSLLLGSTGGGKVDDTVRVTSRNGGLNLAASTTNNMDQLEDLLSGVVNRTEVQELLDTMPELTGSYREQLLQRVQDRDLHTITNELYRNGRAIDDGGTASILMNEFSNGGNRHLQKAKDREKELRNIIRNKKMGLNDLDIAEAMLNDLQYAISLFE